MTFIASFRLFFARLSMVLCWQNSRWSLLEFCRYHNIFLFNINGRSDFLLDTYNTFLFLLGNKRYGDLLIGDWLIATNNWILCLTHCNALYSFYAHFAWQSRLRLVASNTLQHTTWIVVIWAVNSIASLVLQCWHINGLPNLVKSIETFIGACKPYLT